MATQTLPFVTPEQYLEYERQAEFKSEYLEGEIFCMSGASPPHVLIASNALRALGNKIEGGPCHVYGSDLRVAANPKKSYFYPDVSVICGPLEFVDGRKDTVTNPKVVVDVLSPSTRGIDFGQKFYAYLRVPSITDIIFIEQGKVSIEHWYRNEDGGWKDSALEDMNGTLEIPSLNCSIPVAQIYAGVDLAGSAQ